MRKDSRVTIEHGKIVILNDEMMVEVNTYQGTISVTPQRSNGFVTKSVEEKQSILKVKHRPFLIVGKDGWARTTSEDPEADRKSVANGYRGEPLEAIEISQREYRRLQLTPFGTRWHAVAKQIIAKHKKNAKPTKRKR